MLTVRPLVKYDCDVLIVGGGPAGSGLAFHLASMGHKVWVAEAEQFPRDKVCGDGVSPIALAELVPMGITDSEEFKKANEITQVGLFIKNDKVIINLSKPDHLPYHARIIPRLQLDNWVFLAAKKAGANYLENTRVTDYAVHTYGVQINVKQGQQKISINAKMIIGADGSSTTIGRQLNGKPPDDENRLLGLRSYYQDIHGPTNRVDIFFTEKSFPGIFWLFPQGATGANIGMAMVAQTLPHKPSQVKEMLAGFIDNNVDIKERIGKGTINGKIQGWPITFFNSKKIITANRVALVGEAAGLINPLSGDGIQYALLSARWASETIHQCIVENDFSDMALGRYRCKVDRELSYDFSLSNLLVQFPRNKTFSKVWMTVLETMVARAKNDKVYADIIAGIFEGTYPSYQALTAPFILKSIKEGINQLGLGVSNSLQNNSAYPQHFFKQVSGALSMLADLNNYQQQHTGWLKDTALKTLNLAGHVIRHIKLK